MSSREDDEVVDGDVTGWVWRARRWKMSELYNGELAPAKRNGMGIS